MSPETDSWDDLRQRLTRAGFTPEDAQDVCTIVAQWGHDDQPTSGWRRSLEVFLPLCTCGHPALSHMYRDATKTLPERRTRCTVGGDTVLCNCPGYELPLHPQDIP